ncbi:hypothetical protein SAMN04487967_1735 [Natronorubrum sediminis]|uniref:Uncharacterized protein n=1 Tax=Natronorubrum sediminis TaxID=640943 RepID=A0A1H6FVA3_9EURY|nr:hypothetical protein [Natronorubrum sediminis]SEH14719.1 hypothetical protein SAMN04487967_1735 [Natronorubrum sediminis]
MENQAPTLMEDIDRARETHRAHLWGAIISAVVSLFLLPIVGIVAAYSGVKLSNAMDRSWFGYLFAGMGLASVTLWLLGLVLWQLGYFTV